MRYSETLWQDTLLALLYIGGITMLIVPTVSISHAAAISVLSSCQGHTGQSERDTQTRTHTSNAESVNRDRLNMQVQLWLKS